MCTSSWFILKTSTWGLIFVSNRMCAYRKKYLSLNGQKCLFKQKIHSQVKKLLKFFNSSQNAWFIIDSLFWSRVLVVLRHQSSLMAIHPWWENHHRECEIRCYQFLCFDHVIWSPTTSSVFLLRHPCSQNHHREYEIWLVFNFLL